MGTEGDATGTPGPAVSTEPKPDLYERAHIARGNLAAANKITSNPAATGVDESKDDVIDMTDASPAAGTGVDPIEVTGVTPKIEVEEGSAVVPRYPSRVRKSPAHYIPRLNADGK